MQPEFPSSVPGAEREPASSERSRSGEKSLHNEERSIERSPEQQEQRAEAASRAAELAQQGGGSAPVITPVTPTPVTQMTPANDTPSTAADEDLIEKEWVDNAKKIIASTQDDPAERERAIARLQADYLKKRYGKELGAPE